MGYKNQSKGSFSLKYVLNSTVIKGVLKLIDDVYEIKSSSLGIKIVSTLLCFILESDLAYFWEFLRFSFSGSNCMKQNARLLNCTLLKHKEPPRELLYRRYEAILWHFGVFWSKNLNKSTKKDFISFIKQTLWLE